ncbi:REP-associated tyrosine transposase [Parafilimonas sp.]|uniref:REP-associated tyrosine transposase n=1 Tax=Parafilimonas sp. TaxID=1969739 RepID=UPI0039E29080
MSYEFVDGYKIRNQYGLHFMTFTIVDWIDLFSRKLYRDILIKNMQYCRKKKDLLIGAYVIMTNHIHVIWQSKNGKLSGTLRDFKSFCTKELIDAIINEPENRKDWLLHKFNFHANTTNQNKDFKIWTGNNHPEEIFSDDFMRTKVDYIHQNPVRAGWIEKPEDYLYSSASNYIKGKGLMEIDYLY